MGASILAPLQRKSVALLYLVLFAQSLAAIHDSTTTSRNSRHSQVARAIHSRDKNHTRRKATDLDPYGIRQHDPSTARINGVFIGVTPDAGDTGGKVQTMNEVIKSLKGKKPAVFGWYAQVSVHKPFDGSQLFEVMGDLLASNAVFCPAIMPQGGWAGLRYNDNHQAVAIAKVLRKFNDKGISVILRFAHEANWYQRTQEYPGTAADFKEAWAVVAAALRKYAPAVRLFWCPNVADMAEYHKYAPLDMKRDVHLVGIDWYPKKVSTRSNFIKVVKEFHDTFAIDGRKFAMGEAGLHYPASYKERVDWLTQMAMSKDELPQLLFINWYNSKKEYDYKIAGDGLSTTLLTEKLE